MVAVPSQETPETPDDEIGLAEILTQTRAVTPGVIEPVLTNVQKDLVMFNFVLNGEQLVELARVERFGEADDGVQRRFKERRALAIAVAMDEGKHTFRQNMFGDLSGDWRFVEGKLYYEAGCSISIDDGQHRCGGLHLLAPEQLREWEFVVNCTMNVPFEVRIRAFMQQDYGERIDRRLTLLQRHEIGQWDNDAQRRAYELCIFLANDIRSPLKDLIILEETDRRPYEGRHRPAGINVTGLWQAFSSLLGRNSPLVALPPEKQLEVCKNLIRAASDVWKKAWKNPEYVLTTAKGVNAIIRVVLSGRHFRIAVDQNYSYENLCEVFSMIGKFDWTAKTSVGESEAVLRGRLDEAIGKAMENRVTTRKPISA